jgi:hypothetical protein
MGTGRPCRQYSSGRVKIPTKRETSMPPTGYEPAISGSERPETHASDRSATGTDKRDVSPFKPNDLQRRRAVSLLKTKIPRKKSRQTALRGGI